MALTVVVGVTGNVGSRVARGLAEAGAAVRGVSRDPSGVADEMQVIAADLTDRQAALAALEGAEAVYLTPPEGGDDPLGLERAVSSNVISAAREHGVAHLLAHTAVHADRGSTGVGILDNKHLIEQEIVDSGVPYTILRPGWFIQNLFGAKPYLDQGMFSLPWPEDKRWAATSVADVARAALQFIRRGPANAAFDLHVPGGITAAEICQAVGGARGEPIAYQAHEGPIRDYVEPYPVSDAHKDLYAELFAYFRGNEYLGDPERVRGVLHDFDYSTVEDVVTTELYPA
jgi:NAD(P)H dehydrogenase (quinone)